MSGKQFFDTVLGISAAAFTGIVALNFIVNPYAQYPTRVVEPMVQTSRTQKIKLLSQVTTAPDGLILGSSRVLKYEPVYLDQKLGQSFFNAGVNYGKPEDHLALLRFYGARFNKMPETLIIGLDVHAFNGALKTDARLLSNRALMHQIRDIVPFTDRFQGLKELVSWQQTIASLHSMKRQCFGNAEDAPQESFRQDGVIVYHDREQQISEGTYDFAASLEYNKREYKQLFNGYNSLSKYRLDAFLKTVDACGDGDSRVIVFLTPMHPQLSEYLSESTTYVDRRSELVQFLSDQSQLRGFAFTDLSDIHTFGGSPEFFVDGIHPLENNTQRIIDTLVALPTTEAKYAVQ